MKFSLSMPTVHNTRSITQMMQVNWNVVVSLNHEPVFGITSMSNSMMIKGKNTIMKERIWINCVVSEIVFQLLHSDTDTPSYTRSV